MGKKTKVVIENRKFFCDNPDCGITTFAERFDFLSQKGKKTKRLIEKIVDVSLNTTSTTASRTLKDGIADVGKSTICSLLKKDMLVPEKEAVTKVCLEVVSRDGSVSYKSAIEQAGSHLQQVSDRFHLVKGLTDAAKK